ncbi:hypothetical protein [Aeromonas salmonicida]|uniref:hypothetical protein n=1 Tax=Aeromonas salmonicida TaxID=645 RepID=UPI0038D50999
MDHPIDWVIRLPSTASTSAPLLSDVTTTTGLLTTITGKVPADVRTITLKCQAEARVTGVYDIIRGRHGFPSTHGPYIQYAEATTRSGRIISVDGNPLLTARAEIVQGGVSNGVVRFLPSPIPIFSDETDPIESISLHSELFMIDYRAVPGDQINWDPSTSRSTGCSLRFDDAIAANITWSRGTYVGYSPVALNISTTDSVNFGPVMLGASATRQLSIDVSSNGPVSYDLFLRADKAQIGGTGLIGSGSYRIDLPAELGGGAADLTGTTGIPLVAAGEGVTTINSNITLSVPDNADVGEHSANLTVTIRQK